MINEATAYLEGHRRRAKQAQKAYEAALFRSEIEFVSQAELSRLYQHAAQCNREWQQAIDRVKLDTRELQFRLNQGGR